MSKQTRFCLMAFCLSGFALALTADAATITAASCSQSDVQAAIDSANDGDTVVVPAGTSTWTTSSENAPAVSIVEKAITVKGAGMDKTVITDATGAKCFQVPLQVIGAEGKPLRITGLTFDGESSGDGAIKIGGACKSWRIDHCKFDDTGGRGIWAGGYGVIDHCVFVDTSQGVAVLGDGDGSWERPFTPGSANAVYVEDCTFDYSRPNAGALDAYGGARYVFRHNTVINTSVGHHGFDSGGYRSTHSYEIYENTFRITDADVNLPRTMFFRGGTGVVFNNTITRAYQSRRLYALYPIVVTNYRACQGHGTEVCAKWGRCDGTNPLDGNEDSTGYPCRDQIGRTSGQVLEPLYEWGNTLDGQDTDIGVYNFPGCDSPSVHDHVKENRDFYNDTPRPGYTPYPYPHPLTQGALPPPTGLSASAVSSTQIDPAWNAPAGEHDIGGCEIYRNRVFVGSTSSTSYSDTGLAPGTSYRCQVRAYDRSPFTEEVTAATLSGAGS